MQYDNIEIYPTNVCQLACTGCELHDSNASLTIDQVRRIRNSGILERTKGISILGGEPTMWPYLAEFLYMCRDFNANAHIELTTNGIIINPDIIKACVDCDVRINVSYHDDDSIMPHIVYFKKKKLLKKIILVPSIVNARNLTETYKKLNSIGKCVCRPFVGNESKKNLVKYLNKALINSDLPVESSLRKIERGIENNIDIITKASEDKKFYSRYRCKCGNNGVIYTDGKLYHCLSQAMKSHKPTSMKLTENTNPWFDCFFDVCSCDTFELAKK